MAYADSAKKIAKLRADIAKTRKEMEAARATVEPQPFADYTFERAGGGKVKLSELFAGKANLIVIHNMGAGCSYCTLWADGFNGVYDHLANKASFIVASPDQPATQKKFAEGRGWRFPMVSYRGTSFAKDCGYEEDGSPRPGISVFTRNNGTIARVADEPLHPGDDYCIVWPLFDLLPGGPKGWSPKFNY
jgi:predicted dithiol-disulfide oxidoreductase (DUF899 family)